ncbi:MAG TPA: nucleotidyl transferase AbiEii/AbiGii toxin family protein [Coriobacteriia bacterium]|nr:nucleotidyl transferase AbiEii/AbiGii toxin family protein [Coriobacteriia bacterium]
MATRTVRGFNAGEDLLTTPDLLGFTDIPPVAVPTLPLAAQVAEKLHAYTRTYEGARSSTRTKDLIDLALIASMLPMDAAALRTEIDAVFARRGTHEPPAAVPPPAA